MAENIKIIALGGLDEDGKNCTLVEIGDDIFVIGCGVRFPDRSMPGIDYVIPNYDYIAANKSKVRAYFLLHGHDDEIGALAYIYPSAPAPVYGSKVTLKMLEIFTKHVDQDPTMYDFRPVLPTSSFKVAGRTIDYFQTAHNVAESSGVCIETSLGNIVFMGDYVVENAARTGFIHDMNAIANIAKRPTLALMIESEYAERTGYTAPNYKLEKHIESKIKNAQGRTFISIFSTNCYNIDELFRIVAGCRKKIICYDEETSDLIATLQSCGQLAIPKENMAPIDDLIRLRDQDIVILMTGYGAKLFKKIKTLSMGKIDDRRLFIRPTDTFIVGSPSNDGIEVEATDAIDEIYRTGCQVLNIKRKEFLNMHASEEDIKMMISILKPKYYIPVKGLYRSMLHNAMLALSMGIGLTYSSIFILEDGQPLFINEAGAKIASREQMVPHGDILIDATGMGVSADKSEVLADRRKLAEGVVILSCVIDKRRREIVAGPDCQVRGFSFYGESDSVLREVAKIFLSTVNEFLERPTWNVEEVKQNCYEKCLRAIKKQSGREPFVIPLIVER